MPSKSSTVVINLPDSFLLGRVRMRAAQPVHYKWDDGWMCTTGVQQLFCCSGSQTPSSAAPPAAMVNEVKCDPIRCEMCQFGFFLTWLRSSCTQLCFWANKLLKMWLLLFYWKVSFCCFLFFFFFDCTVVLMNCNLWPRVKPSSACYNSLNINYCNFITYHSVCVSDWSIYVDGLAPIWTIICVNFSSPCSSYVFFFSDPAF